MILSSLSKAYILTFPSPASKRIHLLLEGTEHCFDARGPKAVRTTSNESVGFFKNNNISLIIISLNLNGDADLSSNSESSGGLITPSKSESVSPGQVPSQGKSSNGLPDAPESRRELGTSYRFQQSDEMKILMVRTFFTFLFGNGFLTPFSSYVLSIDLLLLFYRLLEPPSPSPVESCH